jgi:glycosyltransferase involved in cell wall biosynthesis
VRLIRQNRLGSAKARNLGAQYASSSVLIFLDAHCVPQAERLEKLLPVLEDQQSSIITPCIVDAMEPQLKGFGVTLESRLTDYVWLVERRDEHPTKYQLLAAPAC